MVYIFPAIFELKDEKLYEAVFPDISSCVTSGNSRKEVFVKASHLLNRKLWDMEYDGRDIPEPADINALEWPKEGFLSYVLADTEKYSAVMAKENPDKHFGLSRIKKEPEKDPEPVQLAG